MTAHARTQRAGGSVGILTVAIAASLLIAAALRPTVRRRRQRVLENASAIVHHNVELLTLLGKLTELRDPETHGHNLRVALYALMFSEALGLPPDAIVRVTKGALLHDVGKLAVPDRVLGKEGPFTPDERRIMQGHVKSGIELVAQAGILNDAAAVVAGHHEWFDGTGYPFGLSGEEIPYEARIFAIIDVFDALTMSRIYRKAALTVAEAIAAMTSERGSHFDPTLLDRFVERARDFSLRVPEDEAAMMVLLRERLLPYLDRFTPAGDKHSALHQHLTERQQVTG
jgi:putative nucleotidyltransferase with HDIG domain